MFAVSRGSLWRKMRCAITSPTPRTKKRKNEVTSCGVSWDRQNAAEIGLLASAGLSVLDSPFLV